MYVCGHAKVVTDCYAYSFLKIMPSYMRTYHSIPVLSTQIYSYFAGVNEYTIVLNMRFLFRVAKCMPMCSKTASYIQKSTLGPLLMQETMGCMCSTYSTVKC